MSALGSETFWGRVALVGVELAVSRRPIPSRIGFKLFNAFSSEGFAINQAFVICLPWPLRHLNVAAEDGIGDIGSDRGAAK